MNRNLDSLKQKRNNDIDSSRDHKNKLIEKLKTKHKEVVSTHTVTQNKTKTASIDYKKLYREMKTSKDKLMKKTIIKNENEISLRKEVRDLKNEIKKMEDLSFNSNVCINEIQSENKLLQNELNEKNNKIEELNNSIFDLSENVLLEQISILKAEIKKMKGNIASKNNEILQIKEVNSKLKIALKEKEVMNVHLKNEELQEQIVDLNRSLVNITKEMKVYKNRCEELENNLDIQRTIDIIGRKINIENFDLFEGISKIYYRFKKLQQTHKKLTSKGTDIRRDLYKQSERETRYGFILDRGETLYFSDIDGTSYRIFASGVKLKVDIPCEALLFGDTAYIIRLLYNLDPTKTEGDKPIEKTGEDIEKKFVPDEENNKEEDEKDIFTFDLKGANVLIVGSRNLTKYKEALLKANGNVETHNPYEESYDVLKNMVKRADIVLACTSHIDHATLGIVQVSIKTQLIGRDNVDTLKARTRFAAINLGLIDS
jgi:myosin heavy subunit